MDFKVMSIFVEFYLSMLGFINYKLFSSLNISYPPTLELPVDKYDSLRDMNTEDIIEEVSGIIQGFVTSFRGLWHHRMICGSIEWFVTSSGGGEYSSSVNCYLGVDQFSAFRLASLICKYLQAKLCAFRIVDHIVC